MIPVLALTLLCATLAAPALAQPAAQAPHWYGAIDIGTLTQKNTLYANPGALTVSGGYRFSPHLAAESGITAVGDSTLVDGSGTRTARQSDMRFLAVAYLPLNPTVEFFGKAGLGLHANRILGTGGYSSNPNAHTTANLILGAGVQLNFDARFGMRLQYEQLGQSKATASDPGADISRVSIGGVLNF